jgi:uncharacterized protein (TIGR02996 family)
VTDLIALLDAVQREPGDALARGVLADWFDDHNDPRGGLVRASNELIRVLDAAVDRDDSGEHVQDYRHVAERLAEHYASWVRRMRSELGPLGFDYETFCGVVDAIHAPVSLWRRVRPEVVAPHPIRALYLRAAFGGDARVAPDTNVPLPQLRALAVSVPWRWHRGIEGLLPDIPASADLDFVRDCPWLSRIETLILDVNADAALLAWAARDLARSKAPRLPAVRFVGSYRRQRETDAGELGELCASPLVRRVTELDLGTLLSGLPPHEVATVLRLPAGGTVRVLTVGFHPDALLTRAPTPNDLEPGLRAVLTSGAAEWARAGRELRWRVVPAHSETPSAAERVLRAYWCAADTEWGLYHWSADRCDDWDYNHGEWDGGGAPDEDWGLTPTRRELYRGRFRNPRR